MQHAAGLAVTPRRDYQQEAHFSHAVPSVLQPWAGSSHAQCPRAGVGSGRDCSSDGQPWPEKQPSKGRHAQGRNGLACWDRDGACGSPPSSQVRPFLPERGVTSAVGCAPSTSSDLASMMRAKADLECAPSSSSDQASMVRAKAGIILYFNACWPETQRCIARMGP